MTSPHFLRLQVKWVVVLSVLSILSILETPPPAYSETGSPSPPDPTLVEQLSPSNVAFLSLNTTLMDPLHL